MRLQLADKYDDQGYSRLRTIVNRETGELFSCGGDMPLANRAVRRARKQARTDRRIYRIKGRESRHDARVDARGARQDARLAKRVKGDDGGDYDEGGGGDYDNSYDGGGEGEEMNDTYELSGIGKTITKLFKKKTPEGEEGKAATDRKPIDAIKIKKPDADIQRRPDKGSFEPPHPSWLDKDTFGVPNGVLAVGAIGAIYLATRK